MNDYYVFDPLIALTKNGSMTKELWSYWVVEFLAYLYPDAQDKPGLRVLIKADSGPGEYNCYIMLEVATTFQSETIYLI